MTIGGYMNKFVYIILLLFFACEDIPQEKDIFIETECIYPLKMYLKYDFIQGSPDENHLIGSNVCHYDDKKRIIKEDIYDFIQGIPTEEYLIGYKTYLYQKKEIIVFYHDFIQGDPNNNYLIGKNVYVK